MNEIVLLTRTGKQFFTYLKSDTKKIEAAINAGFREPTNEDLLAHAEKLNSYSNKDALSNFLSILNNTEQEFILGKIGYVEKPKLEPKPEPKPEQKAPKPEPQKATVESTKTQEPNN